MRATQFTQQELDAYEAYEDVRSQGAFNMFSPAAREATGLGREEYLFTMENYETLRNAFNNIKSDD